MSVNTVIVYKLKNGYMISPDGAQGYGLSLSKCVFIESFNLDKLSREISLMLDAEELVEKKEITK